MTTAPTLQEYVYATQLAYCDDPKGAQASFGVLQNYKYVDKPNLGDGFQAVILREIVENPDAGNLIIAFRGTLPDVTGTVDRAKAVGGDWFSFPEMVSPSFRHRTAADQTALNQAPLIQDLIADIQIFNGKPVRQIQDAVSLVSSYRNERPRRQIYLTGHSLGGGIASGVADAFNELEGTTFASPGDVSWKAGSKGRLLNYVNVNDPVGMVNFDKHVGKVVPLDQVHNSFQVEQELHLPAMQIYGFNETLDTDAALTKQSNNAMEIILGSVGFLVARLATYHPMENYAACVNCKPLDPRRAQKPATIRDLARAANTILSKMFYVAPWATADLAWARIHPMIVPFSIRMTKEGEDIMLKILTTYGQTMMNASQNGMMVMP